MIRESVERRLEEPNLGGRPYGKAFCSSPFCESFHKLFGGPEHS